MRRLLAFALHATAASVMTWGWFSLDTVSDLIESFKGGYFLFLTNQGLVIAWLCMVVSLINDILPSIKLIRAAKRVLLLIALPLAVVISSIYWSLLLLFPRLIVQQGSGLGAALMYLPLPVDLALHALPLLTLLIDFFAFERKFSKAHVRKAAPAAVIAFGTWYASYVEYYSTFNDVFPYPFLTYSSFPGRVLIYAGTAVIALGCFRVLNALHA